MKLQERIYKNIVTQFRAQRKIQDLKNQLQVAQDEHTLAVGSMNTLAELYEEMFGTNLQEDINKSPKWKSAVERARKEAEGSLSAEQDEQPPEIPQEQKAPEVLPEIPRLKSVAENKRAVEMPAPSPAPVATQRERKEQIAERTRPPVSVVIDDNPPQPPSGIRPTEIDDDD